MLQLRSWEESGPPHFFSLEAVCHFLRDQLVCPHLCSQLSLSKLCIAPFVAGWVLVCSQSRRWVLGRRHSYSERRPNSRQSHFRSLFPLSFHSPPAPLSRWIACPLRQRWWCIRACSLSLTSHPIIATHRTCLDRCVSCCFRIHRHPPPCTACTNCTVWGLTFRIALRRYAHQA